MPAASPALISQRLPDGVQTTWTCSIASARAIFDQQLANLAKPVAVLSLGMRLARKPLFLVLVEDVAGAFAEILGLSLNTPAPSVRNLLYGNAPAAALGLPDSRPLVLITSSMKQDVARWAEQRDINLRTPGAVSGALLSAHEPHKHIEAFKPLAARAGAQAVCYVCQQDVIAANKLAFLQGGQWKAAANEERVAKRYLDFVNQYLLSAREAPFLVTS